MTAEADDAALLAEWRSGQRKAIDTLVRRHWPDLLRYFLASTGGDRTRAEDLAQETFVTVVRRADAITSTFRAYCYGVARLKRLEDLRKRGTSGTESIDDEPATEWIGLPEEPTTERQRGRVAMAALRRLKEDDRLMIVLKDYLGFSQAEIAETFKIRAPQVAGRLNRARLRFRRTFEQLEADPVERDLTERSLTTALASIVARLPKALAALAEDD